MRLAFSNNGCFLAGACTMENSRTFIKFWAMEHDCKDVYTYRGHKNIIHELTWSNDDRFIGSCSSDFTAKVWSVNSYTGVEE